MLKPFLRIGTWLALLAGPCAFLSSGQERSSKPARPKPPSESGAQRKPQAPKGIYPTAHGVLKSISGSQFMLEVEEEHELKFHITRKTKIFSQNKEVKASILEPGQTLDIDMQAALDGSFDAIRITIGPANPEPSK